MNDLTLGLAIVGGVALAAVVAHGAWQARRAGPRRASPVAEPPAVAQMEPVLTGPALPAEAALLPRPGLRRANPRLDALIDAIATLRPEVPLAAETVLAHLPPTRRVGSKPFLIEGLNAVSGEWEAVSAGADAQYGELQAGVQLANRTGALNEIEYSEFVQKVQAFAEAVGAMAELPDMLDVVGRARELDAFASEHDAQLALTLQADASAWSVGFLQQQAAGRGFVAGMLPGRMVLPAADDGAPPVLVLSFDAQAALAEDADAAAVRAATLSFDVAQTDAAAQPLAAWQANAEALALGMDARVVDDQGRPLTEAGFASIRAELERLYAALAAHDLAAGSPAARRLFS